MEIGQIFHNRYINSPHNEENGIGQEEVKSKKLPSKHASRPPIRSSLPLHPLRSLCFGARVRNQSVFILESGLGLGFMYMKG